MPGVFRLQLLRKAGNDLSCDDFWITPQQQSKFQIVQGTDLAAMASVTCNSIIEVQEQTIVSERKQKTPAINYSPGAGDGGEGQRIFFFVTMKCTSKENKNTSSIFISNVILTATRSI